MQFCSGITKDTLCLAIFNLSMYSKCLLQNQLLSPDLLTYLPPDSVVHCTAPKIKMMKLPPHFRSPFLNHFITDDLISKVLIQNTWNLFIIKPLLQGHNFVQYNFIACFSTEL